MADPIENKEVMEAVGELREELKKNAPNLAKIETIETALQAQEDLNQKNLKELEAFKTSETGFKERMDELELALSRSGGAGEGKNYKDSAEYKAMNEMVRVGKEFLDPEMKAMLRTDNDVSGGYLVTTEMDNVITKEIEEISNIRSVARVRTISSKAIELPIRKTIPSATFEGEAGSASESESTYGKETVTPFRQTFKSLATKDQLMDAAFDMESEMMMDAAESFAKGEGSGHVSGTGFKQPEGFLVNATIVANTRSSSTSGVVEASDVIRLTGDLKTGYDPVYVLNRTTLADLRTKESTTGQFLWQPGMNGPVANTINGFPYLIAQDMPDIASNSLSIAFGDFRRGYTIVDRTGMSVVRDELTLADDAIVKFIWHRWTTGMVTLPEAIKVLKTLA